MRIDLNLEGKIRYVKLKKSKAQHMLIDRKVLKKIVEYAEIEGDDVVLEVGCGTGNLTDALLKRSHVIGIEFDKDMVKHLKFRFKKEIEKGKFRLIHADALKIDFPPFTKFVSNIPYKISSPLTFKLLNYKFKVAVVMYQREFAERLCKPDKIPNKLGIIAKSYCKAEMLDVIKPTAFKPKPKVESAIVKITPKPELVINNKKLFEDFIKFIFSMRRKKLGKSIEEWSKIRNVEIEVPNGLRDKRVEEVDFRIFAEMLHDIRTC